MPSVFQVTRSFGRKDREVRLREMREHAKADPGGCSSYLLALALWEEGEIDEAHQMAQALLANEPDDFRMLVICLDKSIRVEDVDGTLHYSQRVVAAKSPAPLIRRINRGFTILFWPLALLGYGRAHAQEAEALDKWLEWAQAYIDSRAPAAASAG